MPSRRRLGRSAFGNPGTPGSPTGYSVVRDTNADGRVDNLDVLAFLRSTPRTLPAGNPAASASPGPAPMTVAAARAERAIAASPTRELFSVAPVLG